jgi:hypothetical protein
MFCFETSSHSNAMLQIYVEKRDRQQRYGSEIIFSKLNLVDLAGCEKSNGIFFEKTKNFFISCKTTDKKNIFFFSFLFS